MLNSNKTKEIKILFFIDTLRSGGKERQLVELLKRISSVNHITIELLMMHKEIHYREIFDLKLSINYLNRKNKIDFLLLFKLLKIVKNFNPDILHSWSTMTVLYGGLVAKLTGVKQICGSVRGATNIKKYSKQWLVDKIGFWLSDRVVANSYAGLKSRNLINNKKAKVIHNGFDFERIKYLDNPETIKKNFGILTNKIVGMVGSLDNRKDNEIFIEAAKKILSIQKDVTFMIVGEGPKYDYLKSMIDKTLSPFVIFTGRQGQIESIVNIFNIGVLTSKNEFFREGISNSLMEYMALEKPVIATDSGGNSEIVVDQKTGFLIKPKDLNSLVEKIVFLLNHPESAINMGKFGKRRIAEKFNIKKMANNYINLYEDLAN